MTPTAYVIAFTDEASKFICRVDTALMGDMKTIINGFYKVKLAVLNIVFG